MVNRLNRLDRGYFDPCCCPEASTTGGCLNPTWSDDFSTNPINTTYNDVNGGGPLAYTTGGKLFGAQNEVVRLACWPTVGQRVDISGKWSSANPTSDHVFLRLVFGSVTIFGTGTMFYGYNPIGSSSGGPVYTWEFSSTPASSGEVPAVIPASGDLMTLSIHRQSTNNYNVDMKIAAAIVQSVTGLSLAASPSTALPLAETAYGVIFGAGNTTAGVLFDDFSVADAST